MPEGRIIQEMNIEDIPSIRRNPVIADIFAQLGYMERKGSGITFPNIIQVWEEGHSGIEIDYKKGDTQGDTQDIPQGNDLDKWIEYRFIIP